jgi:hypothetical protein
MEAIVMACPSGSAISNSCAWVCDLGLQRQAYRDWLTQYEWQWFVTLAPRHGESREKVKGIASATVNRLGRELLGRGWYKQCPEPLLSIIAIEEKDAVRPHAHMLVMSRGVTIGREDIDGSLGLARARLGIARAERVRSVELSVAYLVEDLGRGTDLIPSKGCIYKNKDAGRLN